MAWLILIAAGLFEIVWAVAMKYSQGFSRLWPTVITAVAMAVSVYLLAISLRSLPLGTAYAIWTGIGAAGTAIIGMILFGESREMVRIFCLVLIVAGIAGLRIWH